MTTPLALSTHQRPDGTWVLTAAGEIDMSNADSFRAALAQAGTGDGPLVVDLTSVEYLDSAGLTVLFRHASRIELIATPLLAPVLTISGLADVTTMHGLDGSPDGDPRERQ
jgi:anti-anti-sigma factor